MDRLAAMSTYVRVIDAGSFSAAARQLQLGQPAVSKSVAQLEDWLGVRLLTRNTRSLSPTEAGRVFYQRALRAIEEADAAVLSARGTAAGLKGRLHVAAAACFARIHIVPFLPAFMAEHPDLELDLNLDERVIDLIDEGVDVALRSGAMTDSSMVARKIAEARRTVMATPAYLAGYGAPQEPADLLRHQAVIYTRDRGGRDWTFRKAGVAVDVALTGRVRMTSSEGVRAAVLAGMGVAVAPEWLFTPELRSGAVTVAMADWELPSLPLWAVFPTGRRASLKARAFVAFVEDCLSGLLPGGIHAGAE